MSVIENFVELSFEEQKAFAEALVKTINSESIFTDQANFKISGVEADEMTGGLTIELEPEDTIDVQRSATWTCGDREEASNTPDDPDFAELTFSDAKRAFKTSAVELEGYSVVLDIVDVDTEEITDVEVDSVRDEDAGIGSYEYWGDVRYDSQPYCEVEGTLTQACTVYCSLFVEAVDHFQAEETDED